LANARQPNFSHYCGFAQLEQLLASGGREQVYDASYDSGPSSLVAGAEPRPIVAMEAFVEQQQIPPMRIFLEFPVPP
jgi:hypothetical protein